MSIIFSPQSAFAAAVPDDWYSPVYPSEYMFSAIWYVITGLVFVDGVMNHFALNEKFKQMKELSGDVDLDERLETHYFEETKVDGKLVLKMHKKRDNEDPSKLDIFR